MNITCFLHALSWKISWYTKRGWQLEYHTKENTWKVELICVCLIRTPSLGALEYEYPFLGRRHKTHIKIAFVLGSYRSILASLWNLLKYISTPFFSHFHLRACHITTTFHSNSRITCINHELLIQWPWEAPLILSSSSPSLSSNIVIGAYRLHYVK